MKDYHGNHAGRSELSVVIGGSAVNARF